MIADDHRTEDTLFIRFLATGSDIPCPDSFDRVVAKLGTTAFVS